MKKDPYQNIAKWYDKFFEPFNRGLRAIGVKMFPPWKGMAVLDVGCGTGVHLEIYQKAGCDVFGIDMSPGMLQAARTRLGEDAELCLGDASKMPYPDEKFDLIMMTMVLHEMPPAVRSAVIDESKRTLKQNGRILLIDYHPGPVRPLKGWVFKGIIILIERITGISDVMQGRGDVRQRTARGIERLFEAGSARIGLSVKLFEDSFKEAAYQMGSLVRQYYQEDREINITGGLPESFVINPEELKEEMEVSIDSAAALPKDKQSRAELVFTLLKNHIFEIAMADDPKMKMIGKIVLDAVEFPNREAILNFTPDQLTKAFPSMGNQLNMQSQAQMPEFAGMPVLNSALEELAAAAQVSPEEMVEMIQSGVQQIARPTS